MNINVLFETISYEQSLIEEFNRRLSVLDEKKRKKCTIRPTDSANKIRRKCKQARVWGLHYAPVWNRYVQQNQEPTTDTGTDTATDTGGEVGGGEGGGGVGEAGFVYPMSIGAENDPRLINDELLSDEPTLKTISYIFPDAEFEWKEAERYSNLKDAGIEKWNETLEAGEILRWSELDSVVNYDDDLEQLNPQKISNVRELIKTGEIELPIVARWADGEYELVAGNTRIAMLTKLGYDPYVLVIDMPSPTKKAKPSTKRKSPPKKKEKPKSSTERVRKYYKRHPEKVRKHLRDTQDDRVKRNGDRAKAVKKYGEKKMKNHDVHHPNGVNGGSWRLAKKDHGRDKKNENLEYIYLSELMEGNIPKGPWQLIAEGGAAGHLAHPYEDDTLSFRDVKEMINRALVGALDTEAPVTEKLDGQNIMFSIRDGKIMFARNKGQVKGRGKNSLDVAGIRQMFSGRGNIEQAFGSAAEDLETAVMQLSPEQQQEMFADGSKFMNVEIVFPDNKNVIPYDKNVLVFHGTVEYDDEGNEVSRDINDGKLLSDQLLAVNAEQQQTFGISGPRSIVFSDVDTAKNLKKVKEYTSLVSRLQSDFGLKDTSTIEDYKRAWWAREIDNMGVSWSKQERQGLIDRWATNTKRFGVKNIEDPEKKKLFREFEANQLNKLQRVANRPLERMFLKLGAYTLQRVTNFLSANNPAVSAELKKELIASIEAIQATDDTNRLSKLQIQLERLEDIGMDNLVPSEGLVFIYKGKPYKFTGAFAPINQIIGTLKFKRGKAEDADVETEEPEELPPSTEVPEEPQQEPTEPEQTPQQEPEPEEEPQVQTGEPAEDVVAIFTGRFQPFHAGHYSIYKAMVKKFGEDKVYIATSNATDSIRSPFGFKEKKDIMTKMFGIPDGKVVQVKSPYSPKEILDKLPPNTMYVTAVSEKDAGRLAGGKYFKSYEDTPPEERKGHTENGYYIIAPEMQLQINGKNISGTQIRSLMGSRDITDRAKQEIFTKIYGKFDQKTFDKIVKTATKSEEAKELTATHGGENGAKARMKKAPEQEPQPQPPEGEEEGPGRVYYEPGQYWETENGIFGAKNRKGNVRYFRDQIKAIRYSKM